MLINFMGYQITRIIDWKKIEGQSTTNGKKKTCSRLQLTKKHE